MLSKRKLVKDKKAQVKGTKTYWNNNLTIIKYIENLETYILNSYNKNKQHNYKIHEQITYLSSKICNSSSNKSIFSYIFKISGIWETNTVIGITYKFIDINHQ